MRSTDWKELTRAASRPILFFLWIVSWVAIPLLGLSVFGFGRTAFVGTGMSVVVAPPLVWLAFRGSRNDGEGHYRSPGPFLLFGFLCGLVGAIVLVAGSRGAPPVICLILMLFFFALVMAATHSNSRQRSNQGSGRDG